MTTLPATQRTETGKAFRKTAAIENMPAIVYGPKQEPIAITIPLRDFERVLRNEGESSVLELSGLGKSLQVLIHEVDRDPVTTTPRHADFYVIEKGAKVEVEVPLIFTGESPAVRAGANMVTVLREVTIEADATHIPHEIEIDISVLENVGDQIHVKDIKLSSGVEMITEADEVVVLIQEVEVEAETPAEGVDMASIEVEKKGKSEDSEEAEG